MKVNSIKLTALCVAMATTFLVSNIGLARQESRAADLFAERTVSDAATLVRQQSQARPALNRFFGSATTAFGLATRTSWNRYDAETAGLLNESSTKVKELVNILKSSESDEEKKTEAKESIKAELETQYDIHLTHHEKPLLELEAKLAKLRSEFDARKTARDELVKLRLDNIWYNSQGMGWPDDRRTGSSLFPSNLPQVPGQRGIYFDRPAAESPFADDRPRSNTQRRDAFPPPIRTESRSKDGGR